MNTIFISDIEDTPDSPIAPGKRKVNVLSSDTEDETPKSNGMHCLHIFSSY